MKPCTPRCPPEPRFLYNCQTIPPEVVICCITGELYAGNFTGGARTSTGVLNHGCDTDPDTLVVIGTNLNGTADLGFLGVGYANSSVDWAYDCDSGKVVFRFFYEATSMTNANPIWPGPHVPNTEVDPDWYLSMPLVLPDPYVEGDRITLSFECEDPTDPVPCEPIDCFPDCISGTIDCDGVTESHSLLFVEIAGPTGCCLDSLNNMPFDGSGGYHMQEMSCPNGSRIEIWMACDGGDINLRVKITDPTGGISDTTSTITLTCTDGNVSHSFSYPCSAFIASLDYCDGYNGFVTVTIFSNN